MESEDKVGRVINVYSKKVCAELFLEIKYEMVLVIDSVGGWLRKLRIGQKVNRSIRVVTAMMQPVHFYSLSLQIPRKRGKNKG